MTRIHVESDQREAVTALVKSSLAVQREVLQAGLKRSKLRLKAFEQQFGQPSQKFYRAYQAGKMGDEEPVMEWAGEWETYQELTKILKLLRETEVC